MHFYKEMDGEQSCHRLRRSLAGASSLCTSLRLLACGTSTAPANACLQASPSWEKQFVRLVWDWHGCRFGRFTTPAPSLRLFHSSPRQHSFLVWPGSSLDWCGLQRPTSRGSSGPPRALRRLPSPADLTFPCPSWRQSEHFAPPPPHNPSLGLFFLFYIFITCVFKRIIAKLNN